MVAADREIRNDVELASVGPECLLEQLMEARRDDELVRGAALGDRAVELGQRVVDRSGGGVAVEELVELVVERPDAVCQSDVLGNVSEIANVLGRTAERVREMGDDLTRAWELLPLAVAGPVDVGAENDDKPTRQRGANDVGEVVIREAGGRRTLESRFLPEDRALQILQLAARLDPELVHKCSPCIEIRLKGFRLPP